MLLVLLLLKIALGSQYPGGTPNWDGPNWSDVTLTTSQHPIQLEPSSISEYFYVSHFQQYCLILECHFLYKEFFLKNIEKIRAYTLFHVDH
jgi:hypothetical protein